MAVLPEAFADLEPFAGWAVQGEYARYAKRFTSTMGELDAFYNAAFPRLEDAQAYLEKVPYDSSMSEEDKRLTWLFCALCTASFPVEAWRQPRVPDSGPSSIDAVDEPAI